MNLQEKDKKYIWHPFTQMKDWIQEEQLIIERGEGNYLIDTQGNKYFDGVSSLWVNVHGHCNERLNEALIKQLKKISHSTLLGLSNTKAIELAEKLIEIVPEGLTKVFYSDNGSTAVEIAIKMAFQYFQHKGYREKTKFAYITHSYHGDTIGAVSVGGIELFHSIFRPLLFNTVKLPSFYCYRCEFGLERKSCNMDCLKKAKEILEKNKEDLAALVMEPIVQGAGGMIVHPEGVLKELAEYCKKLDILLILDEVATGFGRTGKMFACEYENVVPDFLCVAKGITGGYLPFAATITKEEIFNAFLGEYEEFKTFFHGHTYTGNPLACAVAIENLKLFEENRIIEKMVEKIYFFNKCLKIFENHRNVGEVRQKGFMVGIEIVKDRDNKEIFPIKEKVGIRISQNARKYGLITRPLGNVLVLMPPLSSSNDELHFVTEALYKSLCDILGE